MWSCVNSLSSSTENALWDLPPPLVIITQRSSMATVCSCLEATPVIFIPTGPIKTTSTSIASTHVHGSLGNSRPTPRSLFRVPHTAQPSTVTGCGFSRAMMAASDWTTCGTPPWCRLSGTKAVNGLKWLRWATFRLPVAISQWQSPTAPCTSSPARSPARKWRTKFFNSTSIRSRGRAFPPTTSCAAASTRPASVLGTQWSLSIATFTCSAERERLCCPTFYTGEILDFFWFWLYEMIVEKKSFPSIMSGRITLLMKNTWLKIIRPTSYTGSTACKRARSSDILLMLQTAGIV